MKKTLFSLFLIFASFSKNNAQDTFSILAFDSITREVGAAGASCVDLFNYQITNHFICELFPGVGAIATQASYLTSNQNPEVKDTRNGILNVFLGNKTTTYNIKGADLIKKSSCPSWFSYSARKNCEIKKSWANFLMCLILMDEIHKGILLADEYNQKIIILDNKMSRSIVGIAPKVTDANYNLAKLLDPKGNNILNSIADTTTRKIIADILKMITIRQEQASKEDEKRENPTFKKLTSSKIQQKFPILKKTIQEESDDDENDTGSA